MIINLPLKWSITSVRSHNRSEMLGGNSMKRHKFAWLLAAGVASLMVGACGGNDPDYGVRPSLGSGFVPGAGIAPPRFAYVVHSNTNNVSGYNVDATTGVLTPMATAPSIWTWDTGSIPSSIAVDPLVKFAYVTNSGSAGSGLANNSVSIFSIDGTTGVLNSAFPPVLAGTQPKSVAIDPLGRYAYVANAGSDDVSAYARDVNTGALAFLGNFQVGSSDDSPWSVVVDPSGKFVYVANFHSNTVAIFTIDSASSTSGIAGALTYVNSIPVGVGPNCVTVAPSGNYLYVTHETGDSVSTYKIDASTGALSSKDIDTSPGSTPTAVAIEPNGRYAYVSQQQANAVAVYSILPGGATPGALMPLSGSDARVLISDPVNAGPSYVAADPSGKFVYVAHLNGGKISAYKITQSTGPGATGSLATPVTGMPFDKDGAAGVNQSDFILITK